MSSIFSAINTANNPQICGMPKSVRVCLMELLHMEEREDSLKVISLPCGMAFVMEHFCISSRNGTH